MHTDVERAKARSLPRVVVDELIASCDARRLAPARIAAAGRVGASGQLRSLRSRYADLAPHHTFRVPLDVSHSADWAGCVVSPGRIEASRSGGLGGGKRRASDTAQQEYVSVVAMEETNASVQFKGLWSAGNV